MFLLLDAHALLWFLSDDSRLSALARKLIEGEDSVVLVSIATLWEITIKNALGKLPLPRPIAEFMQVELQKNEFDILPIVPAHLEFLATLPFHHRDPFDRILAAQALKENIPLISADAALDAYGIQRLW